MERAIRRVGYLRNIRFDTIKVDRSFVQGAAKSKAESIAIIRAVVALAGALDITTLTAEGVETEAEMTMIQQMGCTKLQGYYFGRPKKRRMPIQRRCSADPQQSVA